jgi:hypothetical protein
VTVANRGRHGTPPRTRRAAKRWSAPAGALACVVVVRSVASTARDLGAHIPLPGDRTASAALGDGGDPARAVALNRARAASRCGSRPPIRGSVPRARRRRARGDRGDRAAPPASVLYARVAFAATVPAVGRDRHAQAAFFEGAVVRTDQHAT